MILHFKKENMEKTRAQYQKEYQERKKNPEVKGKKSSSVSERVSGSEKK